MEEKEYSISDIIKENTAMKNMHTYQKGNIYLNSNQIEVLKKYHIPYQQYTKVKQLMYEIEENLSDEEDLEQVLIDLAEFDYYYSTHK